MEQQASRAFTDAYCPHCQLLVERNVGNDWPPSPLRCPHCRLLIGSGRSRDEPAGEPGARGTAAGVFAQEAKRGKDGSDRASAAAVRRAIRDVAEALDTRPERLLMVDYQQRASGDAGLPSLRAVFGAYGSWKRARRQAAAES
jgi:hypothetical protein